MEGDGDKNWKEEDGDESISIRLLITSGLSAGGSRGEIISNVERRISGLSVIGAGGAG